MRKYNVSFKLLFALIVFAFAIVSCDESAPMKVEDSTISDEETLLLNESDDVMDEVDNIVDDFLSEEFDVASKEASKSDGKGYDGRPDCVTKTKVNDGTTKTVTYDFGEGCTMPNDDVLVGKIIITYVNDDDAATKTVTQTFENFSFNDIVVEGENIHVRTKENENGNPQSVKTTNINLTWPDGETSTIAGTKTREFIEGAETRSWSDNVYLISGNWTHEFSNGTTYSSTITTDLRREMSCKYIVSGTVDIVSEERVGILDYGDGTCDNLATFTDSEGNVSEITLKRRCKKK